MARDDLVISVIVRKKLEPKCSQPGLKNAAAWWYSCSLQSWGAAAGPWHPAHPQNLLHFCKPTAIALWSQLLLWVNSSVAVV